MRSLEEDLSVLYCASCGRSGQISRQEVGEWCGWCAAATTTELRTVRVLTREVADRHTVDGVVVDPENIPLQPLRIPQGWLVSYNGGLHELDPTENTVAWWWIFKSDMMTLVHEGRQRLLDVSWTGEGDFENGRYRLSLIEGTDYRGALLHTRETRSRAELVEELESILQAVTDGRR